MALYKKFRKGIRKTVRKGIRSVARKYVSSNRKYKYIKRGKPSTMGISKALSNLTRKLSVSAESKTLDQTHVSGSPDVALRQFFNIQASAIEATPSTTTTAGLSGYLNRQISMPIQGDGMSNYDGQKYLVSSINWRGTVSLQYSTNANGGPPAYIKMYIVQHNDNIDQPFAMNEFLTPDNHGEYSTMSRRNRDNLKDYKVVGFKQYKLTYGQSTRVDFNLQSFPNTIIRHEDTGPSFIPKRFYCVAVVSPDIADRLTTVQYSGYTRMRFTA